MHSLLSFELWIHQMNLVVLLTHWAKVVHLHAEKIQANVSLCWTDKDNNYNLQLLASNLSSFPIDRFWFTFSPKTISLFIAFIKTFFSSYKSVYLNFQGCSFRRLIVTNGVVGQTSQYFITKLLQCIWFTQSLITRMHSLIYMVYRKYLWANRKPVFYGSFHPIFTEKFVCRIIRSYIVLINKLSNREQICIYF